MAILWIDGFDHYGDITNLTGYGVYGLRTNCSLETSSVRTGTTSLRIASGSNSRLTKQLPSDQASVGVGYAFWLTNATSRPEGLTLVRFNGPGGATPTQCWVSVDQDGHLNLYRGSSLFNPPNTGSLIFRTTQQVVFSQAWQHFECFYEPDGATSSIEVRIDGVTWINESSFPIGSTTFGGTTDTVATTVAIENINGGTNFYIDDFYIWNTSGAYNNDFIGDKKVATLMPNADTSVADWTPDSGSDGYARIDEIGPDGDTSYIGTDTPGDESEFDYEAMPAEAIAINAVMALPAAKKTDAGDCTIRTDIVSGGDDTAGTLRPITTAYTYWPDVFETDPATGALWTKSGVDAARVRIIRES